MVKAVSKGGDIMLLMLLAELADVSFANAAASLGMAGGAGRGRVAFFVALARDGGGTVEALPHFLSCDSTLPLLGPLSWSFILADDAGQGDEGILHAAGQLRLGGRAELMRRRPE